jgi:hypothetical protein
LDVEIPVLTRADEIGEMARAVDAFKLGLQENLDLKRENEEAQNRASDERTQSLRSLANTVETEMERAVQASINAPKLSLR